MTKPAGRGLAGDPVDVAFFDEMMSRHLPRLFIAVMRWLPSEPRCRLCHAPYGGVAGRIMRRFGFGPSRKNPSLCNTCFEKAPMGGVEMEIGVLIRSAIVDKLVGDEVMALYLPQLLGESWEDDLLRDATDLLASVGYGTPDEPWLALGVGIDVGRAHVGNVGAGEVKDFTALGDVVNTAARLQSAAGAGQIVLSERLFERLAAGPPDATSTSLDLKGKHEAVSARVIDLSGTRTG